MTVIDSASPGLIASLRAVWDYRELLLFLIWRDVKVRYQQTLIGAGWAVLQPLLTMLVFTLVFGRLARLPSDGVPYPIFAFTALLPWNYFAGALSRAGGSLVGNANLITKVYFPRLVIPLSAALSGLVDFAIAFLLLLVMLVYYHVRLTAAVWLLPLLLLLAVATALAAGLWLGALNVRYRDVGYVIPFLTQIWMYASPVVYPLSLVPARWRFVYALNPMVGVIEGFRAVLLGTGALDGATLAVSSAVVFGLLLTGALYFSRTEQTFADVI
jgi:lipopolysaccharide transport system permease protein